MAIEQVVQKLENRYAELQRVSDSVFRGVDMYGGRPYAIRYFDIGADPVATAPHLQEYLDKLIGSREAALDHPLSATGFQQWADWALSQADRIDPVLSGSFRTVQDDD